MLLQFVSISFLVEEKSVLKGGFDVMKSNGYPCPEYKVPESYEAITGADGKIRYVPGAHPLVWAESSLYSASKMFAENLARYSK